MIRNAVFLLLGIVFASQAYAGECVSTRSSYSSYDPIDSSLSFEKPEEKALYEHISLTFITHSFDVVVGGVNQSIFMIGYYEEYFLKTISHQKLIEVMGQYTIRGRVENKIEIPRLIISTLPNRSFTQVFGETLFKYTEENTKEFTKLKISTWNRETHETDVATCTLTVMPSYSFQIH